MKTNALIAIAPVYRGFGYVVFDRDRTLLDWGTIETRKDKSVTCLKRARDLLRIFRPKTVVLELTGVPSCRKRQRIRELISDLALLAEELGHTVSFYERSKIIECLDLTRGATKDDIAKAVATQLPAIAHRLPKPRRMWESEKYAMPMFAAAALALAHFAAKPTRIA